MNLYVAVWSNVRTSCSGGPELGSRKGNLYKVKLYLCLTKHHAWRRIGGVEAYIYAFFDFSTR
jgi:hypothetical protein